MGDEADFFGKKKNKQDKADATKDKSKSEQFPNEEEQKVEKTPIVSRPTEQDTYNNNNPKIGIAVIFNHKKIKGQKERAGTEKDRDELQDSLKRYGFDVRVYNELTFEEITEVIKRTAKEDHSQNDCFVLTVMSHGAEGKVYASDMSYPVERLWNPFLGDKCKTLINKPKLFFVQACRGENLDKPAVYTDFQPMSRALDFIAEDIKPPVVTYAIPSTADMLVMYATFDKHFSFRNVENGSWFIQSLCYVLNSAAQNEMTYTTGVDLYSLLTAVNRRVAYEYQSNSKHEALNEMKEMPNFLSTLTKTFYLKVKPQN